MYHIGKIKGISSLKQFCFLQWLLYSFNYFTIYSLCSKKIHVKKNCFEKIYFKHFYYVFWQLIMYNYKYENLLYLQNFISLKSRKQAFIVEVICFNLCENSITYNILKQKEKHIFKHLLYWKTLYNLYLTVCFYHIIFHA